MGVAIDSPGTSSRYTVRGGDSARPALRRSLTRQTSTSAEAPSTRSASLTMFSKAMGHRCKGQGIAVAPVRELGTSARESSYYIGPLSKVADEKGRLELFSHLSTSSPGLEQPRPSEKEATQAISQISIPRGTLSAHRKARQQPSRHRSLHSFTFVGSTSSSCRIEPCVLSLGKRSHWFCSLSIRSRVVTGLDTSAARPHPTKSPCRGLKNRGDSAGFRRAIELPGRSLGHSQLVHR